MAVRQVEDAAATFLELPIDKAIESDLIPDLLNNHLNLRDRVVEAGGEDGTPFGWTYEVAAACAVAVSVTPFSERGWRLCRIALSGEPASRSRRVQPLVANYREWAVTAGQHPELTRPASFVVRAAEVLAADRLSD
jgi:hypothetical protein